MPNPPTTCNHDAPTQKLVPGVAVPCRKCGAPLEPEPGSVNATNAVHSGRVKQKGYPGGH